MSSSKVEFEERLIAKAKKLANLAKEYLQSFQSINALFKFEARK